METRALVGHGHHCSLLPITTGVALPPRGIFGNSERLFRAFQNVVSRTKDGNLSGCTRPTRRTVTSPVPMPMERWDGERPHSGSVQSWDRTEAPSQGVRPGSSSWHVLGCLEAEA